MQDCCGGSRRSRGVVPPIPDSCCLLVRPARGPVGAGQAVFFPLGVPDRVQALDGSLNALLLLAGFAENPAPDGGLVAVRFAGLGSVFSGLVPGVLYFATGAGPPVPFTPVPAGAYARSVGGALNSTTLLVDKGPVLQRGFTMPSSPAAIDSATGAIIIDTAQNQMLTATAGAAVNPFTALYKDSVTGKVFPLDGTLAHVQEYVGVSDGGTYALNATVTYSPPGVPLANGVTGLTPGDTWASTTGTLVQFSAVTALAYTRLVVDAQSTTSGVVVDGPIVQHP